MRVVLQRVAEARVTVDGRVTGAIGQGVLLLVGVAPGDGPEACRWLAQKIAGLRIFPDEAGRMDRSLLDVGGGALVVSQFTLYGDVRKGRRPSFAAAAHPSHAEPTYEAFCEALVAAGLPPDRVQRGVFGAHMDVDLRNDGPVTLILDSPE